VSRRRVDDAAAHVLHAHPFSESSLIIEVFAREHGRLAVLARGARRPRSALRGVLHPFQPLELAWFGGGEVKTLARAEWIGGHPFLHGGALLPAYYLNELLLRLLPREDAHAQLYDIYAATLAALANAGGGEGAAAHLRRFEKHLLREIGYGLQLARDMHGEALSACGRYRYHVERGATPDDGAENSDGVLVSGSTLLELDADLCVTPRSLAESKQLMRYLLSHHLAGAPLHTRRVFIDLQDV